MFRKLQLLLPASAAAAALGVRQALRLDSLSSNLWIDLACLGASTVLTLVCAWLALRSFLCYRRTSRPMRHELDAAGPVGIVVLSLVALVAVLPSCFPPQTPVPDLPARIVAASAVVPPQEVPRKQELVAIAGHGTPVAPPAVEPKPRHRNSGLLLSVETVEGRIFDFQEEEPSPWNLEAPQTYHRLGVPTKPYEWMPPELHIDVLLLEPDGNLNTTENVKIDFDEDLEMRGAGLRLYYDLATARDEGLRFQYQFYGLTAGADLIDLPDAGADELIIWQRFGVSYNWQLLGYSSDAALDFSFALGVMGDNLLTAAHGGVASEVIRLSPYVGAEIGFWQNGPAGLVFRMGQTVPVNISGAEAQVTEFTALFRLDLSKGLSAHLGYGMTWARFRDFSKRASDKGETDEMTLRLQGPVFGFDLRF